MFVELLDEIIKTLAIFRRAAELYIATNEAHAIYFFQGGNRLMETLKLQDDQKVSLQIAIVDAKGNPAVVDGTPIWSSSNEAILTVVAAADGMSAVATAVGPLGPSQIAVTADADLGAGVKPILGTQDVDVVAGEAVSVGITAGTPEPQ